MTFRKLAGLATACFALTAGIAAAAPSFPATIQLDRGFQPEGIAIGPGATFYVGSIPTGAIDRGNLRTGARTDLVQGAAPNTGKAAIGIDVDNRNRLFVAGGNTGKAFVYNARTGATIATYTLTTETTFVNDVVVTRTGAYFTDSVNRVLYRIPIGQRGALGTSSQTIPLTGDLVYETGFNANGIDATPNGRWLVVVQSNTGELFRVNPTTGATTEIVLANDESVPMGDGILLDGRTLYVMQNRANRLAVIAVNAALTSGRVVTRLTDSRFDVPTTLDEFGRRLYLVNARFGTPSPSTADYQVLQLRKPRGR